MRFLAAILAALVLVLSCLPCADTPNGPERQLYPGLIAANAGLQPGDAPPSESHQHDLDLCSPFCVCACCATFSVVVLPFILPEYLVVRQLPAYAQYPSRAPSSLPLPIWQPPQLA